MDLIDLNKLIVGFFRSAVRLPLFPINVVIPELSLSPASLLSTRWIPDSNDRNEMELGVGTAATDNDLLANTAVDSAPVSSVGVARICSDGAKVAGAELVVAKGLNGCGTNSDPAEGIEAGLASDAVLLESGGAEERFGNGGRASVVLDD